MKVKFSEEFKEVLATLGETILLNSFNYVIESETKLHNYEAVWNKEEKCLDITVCPNEDIVGDLTFIYSNINGQTIGEAFTISEVTGLLTDKDTRNYLTVYFPEVVVANIITTQTKENVSLIERPTIVPSISVFSEEFGLLTKDSVEKQYHLGSLDKNTKAPYLNKNGERVQSVLTRKVYKSLTISAVGLEGFLDSSENFTYYAEKGSEYEIINYAVFDLYKIANGEVILLKQNCKEKVEKFSLVADGVDYEIDSTKNTIKFLNTNNLSNKIDVFATVDFIDEEGLTKQIKSNSIRFVTFLDTVIEFSTDFEEEGTPLFLLDSVNTLNSEIGKLVIYANEKIPTENITLESELNSFDDFFSFSVNESVEKDSLYNKFKYTLSINTIKENTTESWYPLSDEGKSILDKVYVVFNGERRKDVEFYCVQKPTNSIKVFAGNSELSNSTPIGYTGPGVITYTGGYVKGYIEGYDKWEATVVNEDTSRVNISSSSGKMMKEGQATTSPFSIFIPAGDKAGDKGYITFKRLKEDYSFDKSYWKDVIYCAETTISFISKEPTAIDTSDPQLIVKSDSPYFFKGSDNIEHGLLCFSRDGGTAYLDILSSNSNLVFSESATMFGEYFSIDMESTPSVVNIEGVSEEIWQSRLKITAIPISGNNSTLSKYDWWPKDANNEPVYAVIGSSTLTKLYYIVYEPDFSNTISFSNTEGNVINSILLDDNRFDNIKVSSLSAEFDSLYPFWTVFSKDSEINIAATYEFDGSLSTISTTNSNVYRNGYDFKPLAIRRAKDRSPSIESLCNDWTSFFTKSSEVSMDIRLIGSDNSETLSIFSISQNGVQTEIDKDNPIELDYVGIYKISIKSEGRFRVILDNETNEKNGLYFYDVDQNKIEDEISIIDYGHFSNTSGNEVCILYTGEEPGNFQEYDKIFDTTLIVENLDDNTSKSINFHRKYYNNQDQTDLNIYDTLDDKTDKVLNIYGQQVDNENGILLPSGEVALLFSEGVNLQDNVIKYHSKLGTKYKVNSYDSGQVSLSNISQVFESQYSSFVTDRGYLDTYIPLNNIYSEDLPTDNYPIEPSLSLTVFNTESEEFPEGFTEESNKIDYLVYRFPAISSAVLDNTEPLTLPSYTSSSEKSFTYEADLSCKLVIEVPEGDTIELDLTEIGGDYTLLNTFTHRTESYSLYYKQEDLTTYKKAYIKITSNDDYIKEGDEVTKPTTTFLNLGVKTYIKASKAVKDYPDIFDQDLCDKKAIPQVKTIYCIREWFSDTDTVVDPNSITVPVNGGDDVTLTFTKKSSYLEIHCDNKPYFVENISYPYGPSSNIAVASFKPRLLSGNYNNIGGLAFPVTTLYTRVWSTIDKNMANLLYNTVLRKESELLEFTIGDEESQPGLDTVQIPTTLEGYTTCLKVHTETYDNLFCDKFYEYNSDWNNWDKPNLLNLNTVNDPYTNSTGTIDIYCGVLDLSAINYNPNDSDSTTYSITAGDYDVNVDLFSEIVGDVGPSADKSIGSTDIDDIHYKYKFSVLIPPTEGFEQRSFRVRADNNSEVICQYFIDSGNRYFIEPYSDYLLTNKVDGRTTTTGDTTVYNLVFNASGYMIRSGENYGSVYIWVLSDCDNAEFMYQLPSDNSTDCSLKISGQDSIIEGMTVDCSLGVLESTKTLRPGTSDQYVYKLKLCGKLLGLNGSSDLLSQGYSLTTRLAISGSEYANYIDIPNTMFGGSSITLTPTKTYYSCQKWSFDLSSDITDIIEYYPSFTEPDPTSNYTSPVKSTKLVEIEGVEVNVDQFSSNMKNYLDLTYLPDVNTNGTVSFDLSFVRKEWKCIGEVLSTTTSSPSLALHICPIDFDINSLDSEPNHLYYDQTSVGGLVLTEDQFWGEIATSGGVTLPNGSYKLVVDNTNYLVGYYQDCSIVANVGASLVQLSIPDYLPSTTTGSSLNANNRSATMLTFDVQNGVITLTSPNSSYIDSVSDGTSDLNLSVNITYNSVETPSEMEYHWEAVTSSLDKVITNDNLVNSELFLVGDNDISLKNEEIFRDDLEDDSEGIPTSRTEGNPRGQFIAPYTSSTYHYNIGKVVQGVGEIEEVGVVSNTSSVNALGYQLKPSALNGAANKLELTYEGDTELGEVNYFIRLYD